jgi:hypothetical protein
MSVRPSAVALGSAVLVLLTGCLPGSTDAVRKEAAPTGPPPVLADNPHMDGATQLLAQRGSGPDTFALPDTSGFPSLILTVTCPSDDTSTSLILENADGSRTGSMGSEGCNGASYETPPLDPGNAPTAVRVTVPEGAGYTVYVYGTQQVQVIG